MKKKTYKEIYNELEKLKAEKKTILLNTCCGDPNNKDPQMAVTCSENWIKLPNLDMYFKVPNNSDLGIMRSQHHLRESLSKAGYELKHE